MDRGMLKDRDNSTVFKICWLLLVMGSVLAAVNVIFVDIFSNLNDLSPEYLQKELSAEYQLFLEWELKREKGILAIYKIYHSRSFQHSDQ